MKPAVYLTLVLVVSVNLSPGAEGFQPKSGLHNFGLEIRYDPIPGVPLVQSRVSPLPADPIKLRTVNRALPMDSPSGTIVASGSSGDGCAELPLSGSEGTGQVEETPVVQLSATGPETEVIVAGTGIASILDRPQDQEYGLPNLVFYKPTGWDYPIVPSSVRNTHTVGPDLNDGDTTFFDFAVANNGSSTAKPRFYTYLYWDGRILGGFYTESLPAGWYTYYNDYPFRMPSGSHLIAGFTDSTNVIAESLENDNRWSATFSWRNTGTALPNLRPYAPTGWDFPVVPSNVRGTHTVGPDLNDYDTTFIDFAVLNDGNATAKPRFFIYMYLDGRVIGGWYADSLPPYYYGYVDDYWAFVQAGTHSLGLVADSTNTVLESNEADNWFSRTFTWRHDPATLPNLTYYTPDTSWDYPVVPSSVRSTHHVGPNLNDRDTTFLDWCIANLGNWVAQPRFYIYLFQDAVPFAGWYLDSLPARTYVYLEDYTRFFPSGLHAIAMFVDSTNVVLESNENDNRYTNTYFWNHVPVPDLAPYAPSGWELPLVPSNVRNTHSVGPDLNDLDTTFIDWAVANFGSATARPRFYTYIYQDGVPFAGWYADSLPAGYYVSVADYPRIITQGSHRLGLFTDSTNAVTESLETNNKFDQSFVWRHRLPAMPNLVPYAPTGWDYPVVPSNVRNTHTVGPDLNDRDTTFVDMAFANIGRAVAKPRFYTYLYSDGTPFAGVYMDSLPAGYYGYAEDIARMFTAGNHLLRLLVDSTNTVVESLETDNEWERNFDWRPGTGLEENCRSASGAGRPLVASVVAGRTRVRFKLSVPASIRLRVLDILGRTVTVLAQGHYADGFHEVDWDCAGAGGIYVLELETPYHRRQVALVAKP
ncbi:MAG: CARDB domain-containing protein [candidate division WOR-3 bacterium]